MAPGSLHQAFEALATGDILLLGLGIAVSYFVVSTAVQWHRLRHIPGPFFCSLTSFWSYLCVLSKDFNTYSLGWQRKYGKLVRITPTGVMVSDPDTIWRINSARSAYVRSDWYGSAKFNPYGDSVITEMDPVRHDKRKAKLISGFSGKGLMDLEGNVDTQIAVLLDVLRSRTDAGKGQAVLDIGRMLHYFQVDLITFTGMGEAWGNLPFDKDNYGFLKQQEKLVVAVSASALVPILRKILYSKYFLSLFGPPMTKGWLGVMRRAVEEQATGETTKNHHETMLDAWLRQGLPLAEAELDLSLLMPAGTETSISTIRGILMYLMITPIVYTKLKQEIAEGIRQGHISSPVKYEEAKKLPYLHAVLNEGMRMAPPLVSGFPKKVPRGGDIVLGERLPEGTDVYMNLIGMMRNTEVFGDDVDVFRPERFLECDEETRSRRLKVININFGHGRWLCLGQILAWMEMHKVFVELLRTFDFSVLNPDVPWRRTSNVAWSIKNFDVRVTHNPID